MHSVRGVARAIALFLLALTLLPVPARAAEGEGTWYTVDAEKKVRLNLYVFYSERCPHCRDALAFLGTLQQRYPWLNVSCYETSRYPTNLDYYRRMAESLNRQAGQVPAFFYCKQMEIGYDSDDRAGKRLERALVRCYEAISKQQGAKPSPEESLSLLGILLVGEPPAPPADQDIPEEAFPEEATVDLPWWGEVAADRVSLPALTVVLGLCDSVNPCAFFVLLFLLSLMVHARSRWRMAVVGGTFVFFSGLVYFLFMAAWLNLFFLVGHLRLVTVLAGAVAVVVALINVKDFFWFKKGVSLSIPEEVKPGLYRRMTRLISVSSLPSLLAGSAVLAASANLYELLCTSGFPMIYTRVLTLRELPAATYYFYLVLYNLIYVAPLALIVTAFTLTLGARKLSEYEGRVLKLLSGLMMLLLGLSLLIYPELLTTLAGAIGLLAAAIAATVVIVLLERRRHSGAVPLARSEKAAAERQEVAAARVAE